MYSNNNSSFAEIKTSLNKVYDRIRIPKTQEKGHELFKKLISKNISNKTLLYALINNIQEKLSKLSKAEKPPYLNLLSLFFFNQSQPELLKQYYLYLSPILSILQSVIIESNNDLVSHISETFGEIVQYLMPNDISASDKELDSEEKESYEALQSFCIINIKIEQDINRIIGSLCLTKLVENCPFVLKKNYMKYILDNIIENISKDNFNAKYELLNCLISLILGAESLFCPFANMTLYKVLDFLTDKDWLKRKLSLNVIYTMIFYCKEEIIPLKEHIINFLNVLKNDKIKEVKEVSILILQMLEENKSIKTISRGINISKSGVEIQEKKNKYNTYNYQKLKIVKKRNNSNNNNIQLKKRSNNKIISTSPNKYYTNKNKKENLRTNNSNKNNINEITSQKRINNEGSNLTYDRNEKKLPVNKRNNSFGKRRAKEMILKKNNNNNNGNEIDKPKEKIKDKDKENGKKLSHPGRSPLSRSLNLSKESNRSTLGLKYPKYVNRKKDFSFVNQKMVIKPDPNKSIFNSNRNMAFFQQAQQQNDDVIVIPKENRTNYNTFNNFYKQKNLLNRKENDEDNEKENKNNLREKIDKDYDNSINTINKLISLDAKIKTDNIKHIDNLIKDENNINKNIEIQNNNNYEKKKNKKKLKNENKEKEENKVKNEINLNNEKNESILNNENKTNTENLNNNNNSNNTNLINILLTEVRALSNKQISLLDLMDEIQTNTQQQIEDLNQKIVDLDTTVRDLNHQLYILQKQQ